MPDSAIITLLTDFGTADYFAAAMKGVILSLQRNVTIVDLTHEIPAHDIATGAFTLMACYRDFPAGTIHVAVVDPGVGSTRRPIAISADHHQFVGPDNGLFSYILDRGESSRVFHLNKRTYFRSQPSATFHGRDIFAPVAAALAGGLAMSESGDEISDPVRLEIPLHCKCVGDGVWTAMILHIDRFGNCVTNIPRESLPADAADRLIIESGGHTITHVYSCYAQGEESPNGLFAIWGSAGFLELSAYCSSAAQRLGVKCGSAIQMRLTATSDRR